MYAYTTPRLVDRIQKRRQVGHYFLAEVVFVIVGTDNEKSGTGDSFFEFWSDNLDSQSGLDLFMMDI